MMKNAIIKLSDKLGSLTSKLNSTQLFNVLFGFNAVPYVYARYYTLYQPLDLEVLDFLIYTSTYNLPIGCLSFLVVNSYIHHHVRTNHFFQNSKYSINKN
jgi:hypothetical protein